MGTAQAALPEAAQKITGVFGARSCDIFDGVLAEHGPARDWGGSLRRETGPGHSARLGPQNEKPAPSKLFLRPFVRAPPPTPATKAGSHFAQSGLSFWTHVTAP